MNRREIVAEAKRMVLYAGPANVLEFADEMFSRYATPDMPKWNHKEEIIAEAVKQALRVYHFLGFEPK